MKRQNGPILRYEDVQQDLNNEILPLLVHKVTAYPKNSEPLVLSLLNQPL
jgi:hypothetical protein